MGSANYAVARPVRHLFEYRPGAPLFPGPRVSEPERRQHIQRRWFRAAVYYCDSDQDIFRRFLRILYEDVEVPVLIEYSGIEQFILEFLARTAPIGLHQVSIRELRLWIFVEILHVGMSRRAVEIEAVLLYIFTVVSFAVRQSEKAFLQDGVFAVPQAQGKAKILLVVGNACEPVFSSAIRSRPRLIVGEIVPGITILAVILSNRAPLTFTRVGSPFSPWQTLNARFLKTLRLRTLIHGCSLPGLTRGAAAPHQKADLAIACPLSG